MKAISMLVSFSLFMSATPAQNTTDWKSMGLKGKVKSVTVQQNYRYKKNGIDFTPWEKQFTNIYQFNPAGRYSEYRQLFTNGNQSYRISYSYDMKAMKGEQAYYDKEDKPTIKKGLTFDDKGRLLKLSNYTKDGAGDGSYTYVYDAKGNNTELFYYKPGGTMGSKTSWVYDEKGNATDVTVETPGYANSYKKFRHDDKGKVIEESWFDGQKQMTLRFLRVYDDKGNMTEELKFKGDNAPLDKTTWKYEYDKQGNWVKKTQYTGDGVDFNIEERVIVYY